MGNQALRFRPTTSEDLPLFVGWMAAPEEFAQWGFGEFRFSWPIDMFQLNEDFDRLTANGYLRMWTGVNTAGTPISMFGMRSEMGGRAARCMQALVAPNRRTRLGAKFLLRSQETVRDQTDVDVVYTMPETHMVSAIGLLEDIGYRPTGQRIRRDFEGVQVDYTEMSCRREELHFPELPPTQAIPIIPGYRG